MQQPLLLASSSTYRRALLEKLDLDFIWQAPDIDESPLPGETALALTQRLAASKARHLQHHYPKHWIIGSDQVCVCDNHIFGKPHTAIRAREQLSFFAGKWVSFHTSLCLFDPATLGQQIATNTYDIELRQCTPEEIAAYVEREQPFNCAGSIKTEGLGINLIKQFRGDDPNSLIGLPLILLLEMLRNWGYNPLSARQSNNCAN